MNFSPSFELKSQVIRDVAKSYISGRKQGLLDLETVMVYLTMEPFKKENIKDIQKWVQSLMNDVRKEVENLEKTYE